VTATRRIGLVIIALVVAVSACGIPSDDEPRALPDGAVDGQVPARNTTPSSSVPNVATTLQKIYLVAGESPGERLTAADVQVEQPSNLAQLPRILLERLIQTRPADVDLAGQATNQVPSDVDVLDATLQPDGVLDLNLSPLGIESRRLQLVMAQLVFTATSLPNVTGVRVSIDGTPIAVATESGNAEVGAVITKDDYASLNPDNQVAQ
jgi:spore germination protein GerM